MTNLVSFFKTIRVLNQWLLKYKQVPRLGEIPQVAHKLTQVTFTTEIIQDLYASLHDRQGITFAFPTTVFSLVGKPNK